MEENTQKALKAYYREGPYQKDAMQVAVRGRLQDDNNSPKSFEEIIVNVCGLHNNTGLQWSAYGCLLDLIHDGMVKVAEVEGKKMYSFTERGAKEESWLLSAESLAEIVLNHYKDRKEREEKRGNDDLW